MIAQEKYFEEGPSINLQSVMLTQYPPPQSDFGYPQQVLTSLEDVDAQSWFSSFLQSSPEGEESMLNLQPESQQQIHIPDWLSSPVNESDQHVPDSSLLNVSCAEQETALTQPRTPLPSITDIQGNELQLISAVLSSGKEEFSPGGSLLNPQKGKLNINENSKSDSMKLPGFHQAFGSTEIGRFSQHEEFFEPPQEDETCMAMHETSDLISKVSPASTSVPHTTSKRGRGARNGTRRTKAMTEKQLQKQSKQSTSSNNQVTAAQSDSIVNNEACNVLPHPALTSVVCKTEVKKEWELSSCEGDNNSKFNHLNNRSMTHEQSNYSNSNGYLPHSPPFNYNQAPRQDRYPPMHHNHPSYYNHLYCPSRYSKDLTNQSQDRFLSMSNTSAEMFRHPNNNYTAHNHYQSSNLENSSLQAQVSPYQSMPSQCWNHQFGMFGSTLPSPNSHHQSYSGMMSSYVSPSCDVMHSSNNEYKNYYYNNYSSSCTEFDGYQANYNGSSNYQFQQRSHPYRRMSYQSQPALPSFSNERMHYN